MRAITGDEWPKYVEATERAFHTAPREADYELWRIGFPLRRSLAVFDGDAIVATAGAFDLDLAVPGGRTLPTAGVTAVGVMATHRRRGLLTALMRRQLTDYHDEGLPLAALWASESVIYGRFGYGVASWLLNLDVATSRARLRDGAPGPVGRLRLVDPASEEARAAIMAVDAATATDRPGRFRRDAEWLGRWLADPEHRRHGAGPLQLVVLDVDGEPAGWATYRVREKWEDWLPSGEVRLGQLRAGSAAAEATLWRYLLELDLVRTLHADNEPVDTALLSLLADPRQVRGLLIDSLYVRIVDVGGALAGRCYGRPVDVVLDVDDPFCPWNTGRWRLSGDETGATCALTADRAELSLTARDLGAAYLGGPTLRSLAAGGRIVEHCPGALASASRAFAGDVAPHCPEEF